MLTWRGLWRRGAQMLVVVSVLAVGAAAQAMPGMSMPQSAPSAKAYQAESTQRMAALLEKIFAASDWKADPNKQAQRVLYYRQLLQQPLSVGDTYTVREEMAKEMLRAGDSAGAVDEMEALRSWLSGKHVTLPQQVDTEFRSWLALAYLRLGEQENCLVAHGQGACIFPIRKSGVHKLPRGAEGAVRELSALLERNADDSQSRWLLNVAYMQLGSYPEGVPKQWLLPASLFASDADIGAFADVAPGAGLDVMGHAGGAVMEDFDGDGRLDIMVSSSGPMDAMHLFHNNGDGSFTDVAERAGLKGETGGLNLVVTDYNNDGHPDVLVLRGGWWGKYGRYPMSLLRNNGDGTFDDVTEQAGLLSFAATQTAAWADFDNDGYLDLFVGYESRPGDPLPSRLFHNNGDGTFTEVKLAGADAVDGFVKGVAWGDFNNDGRPDLFVSVMGGGNRLLRNDGAGEGSGRAMRSWRFTDVTAQAGIDTRQSSFATWFFDYDNDGWPDIFVAGYESDSAQDVGAFEMGLPVKAERPRLYHNNHDGTFTDVTRATRMDRAILVMGANFGDLDNDGYLDVYLGTGDSMYQSLLPNRMFHNRAGKVFDDVTTSGGFGHLQKGHGVAFGDLERTGNEDVFEEMGGALPGDTYMSALYRNPGHANHWVTLRLQGVASNRAAFGARLTLTVVEAGVERRIV
ncbi:MAG: VCBS repeat-containing protein, partial [Acidobacteriota bacterium]|nr:VCBS repeat-containing protein [Acidobacteriota bacterium]